MAVTNVIGKQIVDVLSDANYYFEVAPQGDSQSRYVDVTVLQNGTPYTIPSGSTIILEGKNAGGYNIFISCTQQSANVVRIPLSNGVLSYAGVGKYSVGIYHGGTYVLSFPFNIVVTEAPYDIVSLQASDVYEALNLAIAKAAASNKWIVGSGDPDTSGVIAADNDYYLDASNGNLWQYLKNASGLDWEKVVDTSNKQMNIMEKTYIRYSPNSNGVPMYDTPYDTSTTPPTARDYIGFFITIDSPTDSEVSDPSNYSWSPLRIDVSNVVTEYAKSTSYTTHPTTGWSSTIPLITNDDYLWTKIILELKDGNSFSYYTVTQYGKYGDFGTPTSSIEDTPGEPMVTVTVDPTSPSTAKIFDFDFKIRGGHWKTGNIISGGSTTTPFTVSDFTSADTVVGDMYLNVYTGETYRCTDVSASDSKWIRGFTFSTVTNPTELENTRRAYKILEPGQTSLVIQDTDSMYSKNRAQDMDVTYSAVTPGGTENPQDEGWYEYDSVNDVYFVTADTTVDGSKTYYIKEDTIMYEYRVKFLTSNPKITVAKDSSFDIDNNVATFNAVFDRTTVRKMRVTPVGTENPHALRWYEATTISGVTTFAITTDTTVTANKAYYAEAEVGVEIIMKKRR